MFHFLKQPQLFIPIIITILLVIIGMIGFRLIENYTTLESFYMTIITIATVGFQEVRPLSDAGRIFTSFLIITSFGIFAFAITSVTKYIIDGEFNIHFKNYKVSNAIEKLNDHVIVCGFGRNGKQAVHELKKSGARFVVIEKESSITSNLNSKYSELVLSGDATQDEVLIKAGINKAKALITTLPVDAHNLFIVLSARTLNPNLTIISRASDDNSDKKLLAAGANNVIMPDKIGGAHMASLITKPDVIEFIDVIVGQGGDNIKLEEFTFENISDNYKDKTIHDLQDRTKSGANIIGFKTSNGEYIINPSPDTKIVPASKLFVLGTSEQLITLKKLLLS